MKNEQLAKLAKRAELPRVKREYASNCRAPIWHRVEVGRAQLDRVKQARVKKDAPKWTDSDCTTWEKIARKTESAMDGLCQPRHESHRNDNR